jgi:hypothetical protein
MMKMPGMPDTIDADGTSDASPVRQVMIMRCGCKKGKDGLPSKRAADGGPDWSFAAKPRPAASKGGRRPAGISEMASHHPAMTTMWQECAWADTLFCGRWAEQILIPDVRRCWVKRRAVLKLPDTAPIPPWLVFGDNLWGQMATDIIHGRQKIAIGDAGGTMLNPLKRLTDALQARPRCQNHYAPVCISIENLYRNISARRKWLHHIG